MIRKLRLQNFMRAKDVVIDFGPITILTGATDSGKSLCMRAIDAVLTNKYTASRYSTHGTQRYAISLINDNGAVTLVKGKTAQYQTIDIHTKQKEEFNAIGKDVPLEVQQMLNMPFFPISEDTVLDVLYQSQHKPFFLLTEDRTTFSRVIALISNADKLRKLEGAVNSDILISKRKITQLKDVITDYDGVITTQEVFYADVKDFIDADVKAEVLVKEVEEIDTKLQKLKQVLSLKQEVQKLSSMLEANKFIVQPQKFDILMKFSQKIEILHAQANSAFKGIPDQITGADSLVEKNKLIMLSKTALKQIQEKLKVPDFKSHLLQIITKNLSSAFVQVPDKLKAPDSNERYINSLKINLKDAFMVIPDDLVVPDSNFSQILADHLSNYLISKKEQDSFRKDLLLVNEELETYNGQPCPICGNPLSFGA